MPLFINSSEIESLYINGQEKKVFKINEVPVFGKRYNLTRGDTRGVNVSVYRSKSPNQRASTGYMYGYAPIYYGDQITFYGNIQSGYCYPRLYVKIGKGSRLLRTIPFTTIVSDDIAYDARADYYIKTSGNKAFAELNGKGTPYISYRAKFEHVVISYGEEVGRENIEISGNNVAVPCDIWDCGGRISVSCEGNKLIFEFYQYSGVSKGFGTNCTPKELIITEVKRV